MILDDLRYLPSGEHAQESLLRLLCYVASLSGRVTAAEAVVVETVAEKMGYSDWEFPECPTALNTHDVGVLRSQWTSASERIWLTALFRQLAAADGIICDNEETFLEDLSSRLFSCESIGGSPVLISDLEPDERTIVEAATRAADSISDTSRWHRKTGKAVGAALGVKTPDGINIFTGVNFELSQPAGSRCAEQVAIGSALARYGDRLNYNQVRMIAVAAGQRVPEPISNPLPPCGVCCEMIHKLNQEDDQIQLYLRHHERADCVLRLRFSAYYPPRFQ
jgi:cytidine deaminase